MNPLSLFLSLSLSLTFSLSLSFYLSLFQHFLLTKYSSFLFISSIMSTDLLKSSTKVSFHIKHFQFYVFHLVFFCSFLFFFFSLCYVLIFLNTLECVYKAFFKFLLTNSNICIISGMFLLADFCPGCDLHFFFFFFAFCTIY